MWNLKCTIVPVIIGATGIVMRSLTKNLETIPGKHSIDSLQDSYTCNITHNTESTAVWSLKRERWGSLLVQEKYREEMPVTDISIMMMMMMIIMIIIMCHVCSLFCLHMTIW